MSWLLTVPIVIAVCVGVLAWDVRKGLTWGVYAFLAELGLLALGIMAAIAHII
jgi:hypothetical protein